MVDLVHHPIVPVEAWLALLHRCQELLVVLCDAVHLLFLCLTHEGERALWGHARIVLLALDVVEAAEKAAVVALDLVVALLLVFVALVVAANALRGDRLARVD